ncbi:MAG: hypothetical protein JHD16_09265 [Solirubrobacteraceae bacterium]|nr:hypothetical protein [Solirubrobacteraceae bacterium]
MRALSTQAPAPPTPVAEPDPAAVTSLARPRWLMAMAGSATPLVLGLALAAAPGSAQGAVRPALHHQGARLPAIGGPLAADANAIYTGVGVNGKGTFSLQTNGLGNVSFYNAEWHKNVCGIPSFSLYYDAEGTDGIPVDGAGIFVEEYTITYRAGGKRYTVKAVDSAQIGLVTGTDGVTRDRVTFRQRVKVRRQKAGATWCSGVHKKAFTADRVSGGA